MSMCTYVYIQTYPLYRFGLYESCGTSLQSGAPVPGCLTPSPGSGLHGTKQTNGTHADTQTEYS